jgi:SAM-dependent methyltransferase
MHRLRARIGGWFWGRSFAAGVPKTWLAEPAVRRYVNESVTGAPGVWPIEWLARRVDAKPLPRCVSLGCGDGALERDLARKGLCERVLGLDVSRAAVERARQAAKSEGLAGLAYETADLNHLRLAPASLDAAFVHQALHHVERLERCLGTVREALVDGGLFYLDEYVGPSRAEWRRDLLTEAEAVFRSLPPAARRRSRLRLPLDWRDPTEAIRSSEIVALVRSLFEVVEERPYGGNLLSVIHPHLRLDGLGDAERESLLERLVATERERLARGAPSYYAVLVCRKPGRDARPNAAASNAGSR